MRLIALVAFAWALSPFAAPAAPPAAAEPAAREIAATATPDYADPALWVCRPGREEACTTHLDSMTVAADGTRAPQRFVAAADAPIDCFYVYPTVSREETPYASLTPRPEVVATARAQAGRLAARCRLYAPLYRQATLAHLRDKMAGGAVPSWDGPYRDVLAAWRAYLSRDNHGRGVVLIGHSQGTIVLQRLIAEEIDGKPAQALLVSAFLAGDPVLAVPQGQRVGGTFKHIPTCAAPAETGCAYAWGSYAVDDATPRRLFGHNPGQGLVAACVSPAAPAGGQAALESYLPRPATAPESDPEWIEAVGQMRGGCVADAQGDVLRVSAEPGRHAALLRAMFADAAHDGWGLHRLDVLLVQGNILDRLADQTRTWRARHFAPRD